VRVPVTLVESTQFREYWAPNKEARGTQKTDIAPRTIEDEILGIEPSIAATDQSGKCALWLPIRAEQQASHSSDAAS